MLAENATSQGLFDVRQTALETSKTTLKSVQAQADAVRAREGAAQARAATAQARADAAQRQIEVAQAQVEVTKSRIKDATLISPVTGSGTLSPGRTGRGPRRRRQGVDSRGSERRVYGDLPPIRPGCRVENRRACAHHRRLRTGQIRCRVRQLRVAGSTVHAKAGRDEERAREADVPRQDSDTPRARHTLYRAHQDGRARCRLCEGEPRRQVSGVVGKRPPEPADEPVRVGVIPFFG